MNSELALLLDRCAAVADDLDLVSLKQDYLELRVELEDDTVAWARYLELQQRLQNEAPYPEIEAFIAENELLRRYILVRGEWMEFMGQVRDRLLPSLDLSLLKGGDCGQGGCSGCTEHQ